MQNSLYLLCPDLAVLWWARQGVAVLHSQGLEELSFFEEQVRVVSWVTRPNDEVACPSCSDVLDGLGHHAAVVLGNAVWVSSYNIIIII